LENKEEDDLPPAKLSRFEIGDTDSDNAWELEKYQAEFIYKYMDNHLREMLQESGKSNMLHINQISTVFGPLCTL